MILPLYESVPTITLTLDAGQWISSQAPKWANPFFGVESFHQECFEDGSAKPNQILSPFSCGLIALSCSADIQSARRIVSHFAGGALRETLRYVLRAFLSRRSISSRYGAEG